MSQYYVSPTGNDAATGAFGDPWRTFARGVPFLLPGDSLLAYNGFYDEGLINSVPSGASGAHVTIAAVPGQTAVWLQPLVFGVRNNGRVIYFGNGDSSEPQADSQFIDFDGINIDATAMPFNAVFLDTRGGSSHGYITFSNFHCVNASAAITGTNSAAIAIGGHPAANAGAVAHHCAVVNAEIEGTGGPYGIYITGDYNLVDACNIHDVASLGVQIYDNTRTPTGNVIRNSAIHDIEESFFFDPVTFASIPDTRIGGILSAGVNNLIYNNLLYNLGDAFVGTLTGYGALLSYYGTGQQFVNNTAYNVAFAGINISNLTADVVLSNNIISQVVGGPTLINNATGVTTDQANLLGVDPSIFTSPATQNFRPLTGTSAIGQGVTNTLATTDLAGVARPSGAFDIGAYQGPTGALGSVAGGPLIQFGVSTRVAPPPTTIPGCCTPVGTPPPTSPTTTPTPTPGCNPGGMGVMTKYPFTSGVVPIGADPNDGETFTGKRSMLLWAEFRHANSG